MGSSLQISLVNQKTNGEIVSHLIHQVGPIDAITTDKEYDQSRHYLQKSSSVQRIGLMHLCASRPAA